MSEIKTKSAAFSLIGEQLILCRMLENAEVDVAGVDENFEVTMKLANNKRYAVLVDARVPVQIGKEAMERAQRPEHYSLLIAQAILVNSLANRLIGNFIIKFHKPSAPTLLFSKYDNALNWLKEKIREDSENSEKEKKSARFV